MDNCVADTTREVLRDWLLLGLVVGRFIVLELVVEEETCIEESLGHFFWRFAREVLFI